MNGGVAVAALGAARSGRGVPVRVGGLRRDGLDGGARGGVADQGGALDGLESLVGNNNGLVGGAPVPDGAVPGVPVLLVGGDGGLLGLEGSVVEGLGHCDGVWRRLVDRLIGLALIESGCDDEMRGRRALRLQIYTELAAIRAAKACS